MLSRSQDEVGHFCTKQYWLTIKEGFPGNVIMHDEAGWGWHSIANEVATSTRAIDVVGHPVGVSWGESRKEITVSWASPRDPIGARRWSTASLFVLINCASTRFFQLRAELK